MSGGIRDNYDTKVLSIFNLVGCYFVDVFYNYLYDTSKERHTNSNGKNSITDEYKLAVVGYVKGISENREYFAQTLKGAQNYFQQYTRFSTITLTDFINRVLSKFLPNDYFAEMGEDNKEFFINKIITDIVKEFGKMVIQPAYLTMIIDNHTNADNTKILTTKIVDIQIMEREAIFAEFISGISKRNDVVPAAMFERIKEVFANVLRQKCEYEQNYQKLKKKYLGNKNLVKKLSRENNALHNTATQFQDELRNCKLELLRLRGEKIAQGDPNALQAPYQYRPNPQPEYLPVIPEHIYKPSEHSSPLAPEPPPTNLIPQTIQKFMPPMQTEVQSVESESEESEGEEQSESDGDDDPLTALKKRNGQEVKKINIDDEL